MGLVVVGDSALDVDVHGSMVQSPTGGTAPVMDQGSRRVRASGAGFAARLMADDGHRVTLVTAIGDDDEAGLLRDQLGDVTVVAGRPGAPTPVQTTLHADGRTLARVDRCPQGRPTVTDEMLAALEAADAVLVADQDRGLIRDAKLRRVLAGLVDRVPVVWAPHPDGMRPVRGVAVATLGLAEAQRLSGGMASVESASSVLRTKWQARAVAVRLGGRGALLDDGETWQLAPVSTVTAPEPAGAGDRFAAAVTIGLMQRVDLPEVVERAVHESAAFLAGGGVSVVGGMADVPVMVNPPADPPAAVRRSDGVALKRVVAMADTVRAEGGIVVATGGGYDHITVRHTRTLRAARDLGDCLIVCLRSDGSMIGARNGEADRAEVLAALSCVDDVVIVDDERRDRVLGRLRPDVWVKSGDGVAAARPESDVLRAWGGAVVVVPFQ